MSKSARGSTQWREEPRLPTQDSLARLALRKQMQLTRSNGEETLWVAETSRRIIEGIASTPTPNSHGYALSSAGCCIRLPLPLLSSHGYFGDGRKMAGTLEQCRIGWVVWARKSREQILVRACVDEGYEAADYAWKLIEAGELRAFSGAASRDSYKNLRGVADRVAFFDKWDLLEVSACRAGANPDCLFWIPQR